MALDQSALLGLAEALEVGDGASLMRTALETMLQAFIEAEATAHIGADRHERTDARTTQRNGHRDKTVTTATGDVTLLWVKCVAITSVDAPTAAATVRSDRAPARSSVRRSRRLMT